MIQESESVLSSTLPPIALLGAARRKSELMLVHAKYCQGFQETFQNKDGNMTQVLVAASKTSSCASVSTTLTDHQITDHKYSPARLDIRKPKLAMHVALFQKKSSLSHLLLHYTSPRYPSRNRCFMIGMSQSNLRLGKPSPGAPLQGRPQA